MAVGSSPTTGRKTFGKTKAFLLYQKINHFSNKVLKKKKKKYNRIAVFTLMDIHNWSLYLLTNQSENRTYVGITTNLKRRLRQHNGEIRGGAKATRGRGPWHVVFEIQHLPKTFAHQLEWAVHRLGRRNRPSCLTPLERRFYHVFAVVLARPKVTRNAAPTKNIPYTCVYAPNYFPLEICPTKVVFGTEHKKVSPKDEHTS